MSPANTPFSVSLLKVATVVHGAREAEARRRRLRCAVIGDGLARKRDRNGFRLRIDEAVAGMRVDDAGIALEACEALPIEWIRGEPTRCDVANSRREDEEAPSRSLGQCGRARVVPEAPSGREDDGVPACLARDPLGKRDRSRVGDLDDAARRDTVLRPDRADGKATRRRIGEIHRTRIRR